MATTEPLSIAKLSQLTQPGPYGVELQEGKTYYYCACGLSKNQPFCDGSHKTSGTGLTPVAFTAKETKKHWICACRQSENLPFCDGTHKKEQGIKKYNEFLLKRNTELKNELDEVKKALEAALKK
ncbi:hypothetical protein HDU91_001933 [Kappamyces sp. JEL0680]|nr:hypothetical protein HDU91_001933 [Kappamyces sp. JEL0680]